MENDDTLSVRYKELGISIEAVRDNYVELIRLINEDPKIPAIFIKIDENDVQGVADSIGILPPLSHEFKLKVLDKSLQHYNPGTGVNWDTIDFWIRELIKDHTGD